MRKIPNNNNYANCSHDSHNNCSHDSNGNCSNQLTVRGIIIGCVGCVIITAASVYTALKMGALPWPIVFAALISLVFLRACGSRSLNEANVTHTIMSAGAMVAGGLAFTIPGVWILGAGEVSFSEMLIIALAGTLLGLVASAYLRRLFIERQALEFPIGRAAAETLQAGSAGGRVGAKLFGSMGLAAAWTVLRDMVGAVPAMVLNKLPLAGVSFGVYLSPMMLSVGFLVGTIPMVAWFVGALWQLLFVAGGSAAGMMDVASAQAFNSSLGMGAMMGCGVAVICKDVLPAGVRALRRATGGAAREPAAGESAARETSADETVAREAGAPTGEDASTCASGKSAAQAHDVTAPHVSVSPETAPPPARIRRGLLALAAAALAYVGCVFVGVGSLTSVIVILFAFVTVAMSAQSVGQTGIDPMEIFGLIVLLVVAGIGDTPQLQLFFVAAIIAVACGLGGDVMNDFKAGALLGTSPRAQVAGQAIGGIIGAVVAALSLYVLVSAYGPDAFGVGREFVAAQASVVATLVGGVPSLPAFIAGLVLGFVLYMLRLPSMMVGLGIYLPFYMSLTAFLGCVLKLVVDAFVKRKARSLAPEQRVQAEEAASQTGVVIASGVLGGESIVGVILALCAVSLSL